MRYIQKATKFQPRKNRALTTNNRLSPHHIQLHCIPLNALETL